MNVCVLAVGRLREKYWQDACAEYIRRMGRYGRIVVEEVPDLPEPKNASPAEEAAVMMREGESLLNRIGPRDHVTALCIDAPCLTSVQLARTLAQREMTGEREVFVIGGSLGLGRNVLGRADSRLSMGAMTFPHALARVMLLEQLYRCCKINAGERYHK